MGKAYEVARPPNRGCLSSKWTRTPLSASATEAERPASPPPITITCAGIRKNLTQSCSSAHHDPRLFCPRQARVRLGQDIIAAGFDLLEDAAIGSTQRPQSCVTIPADKILQGRGIRILLPGSIALEAHQFDKRRRRRRSRQVFFATTKPSQVFLRKIDSSHCIVFRHVAKNIGELKCGS